MKSAHVQLLCWLKSNPLNWVTDYGDCGTANVPGKKRWSPRTVEALVQEGVVRSAESTSKNVHAKTYYAK